MSPLAGDDGARFRRGLVIHRLLESLPDLPPEKWEDACDRFLARPAHGLPDDQIADIRGEVLALLRDERFQRLFGPGSLAEVPISGVLDGYVVSGQIDRLVIGDESIAVIDYKTNRPPPADPAAVAPAYLRQMATYRALLGQIYPGRPVECLLLWTAIPRLMPIPDEALAANLPTIERVDYASGGT